MITMTNDKDVTLIIDIVLRGEKYLNEHNGYIDLDDDDDDAVAAMVWQELKDEIIKY